MAIEIVDFPIKNGDFPWQNVSSPEGIDDRLYVILLLADKISSIINENCVYRLINKNC